jgi:Tol biopolymer transport system component
MLPVWSPDGKRIAFRSDRDGGYNIYQKAVDGSAADIILDKDSRSTKLPLDWSSDGRYIIEGTTGDPKTKGDIWVLPLFGDRKPFPYLQTEADETNARLSPDGHWLAYSSGNELRRNEIYVQSFPTPGAVKQLSTNGGDHPIWSKDGKELFFIGGDQKMMAVDVKTGASFEAGVPKSMFVTRLIGRFTSFDVSKDGRFLIPTPIDVPTTPFTLLINWTSALRK